MIDYQMCIRDRSYPLNDEMGKLCCAFEKMKDCLAKNNEIMLRQFAEQRRLNAAFSHCLLYTSFPR